jgi:hypothetical protein
MRNPEFKPFPLTAATLFPTRDEAAALAKHIAADDLHWHYEVNQIDGARWVISVHEIDDTDTYFLGYL